MLMMIDQGARRSLLWIENTHIAGHGEKNGYTALQMNKA
jgi:hypothetical protein